MEGQSSNSPSQHQFLETKLTKMLQNVEPPKMNEHGRESIYRVPQSLRETNPKAYTPRIISIGPFHKARDVGKEDNILESMEELKLKYLKGFLNRTQLPMRQFVDELKRLEESIRSCYAVPIKFNSDDFLETILIDACFIIELFLRWNGYRDWEGAVHLLPKQWILADIRHDLILLENQLPFFVLEELYNLTGMNHKFPSLLEITFNYFKIEGLVTVRPTECPKHFTDLLRTSIISSSKLDHGVPEQPDQINHLYSASQLLEAGLKFKVSTPNESLVDLTYSDQGVLSMPILNIDDSTEIYFRNLVAFEHCHLPNTDIINQYLAILDFLINTEKDVNILVDKKIIVNWMGDTKAVATMVNSLGLNVSMPYFGSDYLSLCNNLNDFYEKPLNKYKAIFVHEYFNTPWKIASTVAAIVLLLLTLTQTICSIISLF